jgi:hypothetical protein
MIRILRVGSDAYWGPRGATLVKKISYYPQRLLNAEVQAITKG